MATLTQEQAISALRHCPIPSDVQELVVLLPRTTRGKPHCDPHTSGGLPFLARRVQPSAGSRRLVMLFLLVFCPPLDRAPVDNEHPIFDQGPIGWHAPAVTSLLKRFQEIPLSEEEAAVD